MTRVGSISVLAVVPVTALILAACAAEPPRSPAQIETDNRTAERVSSALEGDPIFFFDHVDVDVCNGVVTLGGYVWTTEALFAAQGIARRVPGVTRVLDQMELEREAARDGGDGTGSQ